MLLGHCFLGVETRHGACWWVDVDALIQRLLSGLSEVSVRRDLFLEPYPSSPTLMEIGCNILSFLMIPH